MSVNFYYKFPVSVHSASYHFVLYYVLFVRDVMDSKSESDGIRHFSRNPSDTQNTIVTDSKFLFRFNCTVIFVNNK